MKAAKAAGAVTSFDLNFREKLWKISGQREGRRDHRQDRRERDVLVGNEENLQKGWAFPVREVAAKSKARP